MTEPAPVPGCRWIAASGGFILVDERDYGALSSYSWIVDFYRGEPRSIHRGDDGSSVIFSRQVLGFGPDDPEVDHRNGDPLDNRRENLRPATQRQNRYNTKRKRNSVAPYKGITQVRDRWRASIRIEGRSTYLGEFHDPKEAARAYDAAARKAFGEFACVNFPEAGERGAMV